MKPTILFISFIFVAGLSPHANSIVDPAVMYQDIEKRIAEIKNSKAQISDALVSVNLARDERKQLDEWKKSLDEEQGVLEKRLELFRKLQGSGIITYVTPEEKTDEKGALENLPNDGVGKKLLNSFTFRPIGRNAPKLTSLTELDGIPTIPSEN